MATTTLPRTLVADACAFTAASGTAPAVAAAAATGALPVRDNHRRGILATGHADHVADQIACDRRERAAVVAGATARVACPHTLDRVADDPRRLVTTAVAENPHTAAHTVDRLAAAEAARWRRHPHRDHPGPIAAAAANPHASTAAVDELLATLPADRVIGATNRGRNTTPLYRGLRVAAAHPHPVAAHWHDHPHPTPRRCAAAATTDAARRLVDDPNRHVAAAAHTRLAAATTADAAATIAAAARAGGDLFPADVARDLVLAHRVRRRPIPEVAYLSETLGDHVDGWATLFSLAGTWHGHPADAAAAAVAITADNPA